ncbi:MAG: hypothetical protein ACYSRP_01730 [Planctomycetota bacterium]|jgi:hypothetical protein
MLTKKAWEEIGDIKIKRKRKIPKSRPSTKEAVTTPTQQAPIIQLATEREMKEEA